MQIVVVNKVLKARIGHESCDTLEYPRCDKKKLWPQFGFANHLVFIMC